MIFYNRSNTQVVHTTSVSSLKIELFSSTRGTSVLKCSS